jgi:hypothetical protein
MSLPPDLSRRSARGSVEPAFKRHPRLDFIAQVHFDRVGFAFQIIRQERGRILTGVNRRRLISPKSWQKTTPSPGDGYQATKITANEAHLHRSTRPLERSKPGACLRRSRRIFGQHDQVSRTWRSLLPAEQNTMQTKILAGSRIFGYHHAGSNLSRRREPSPLSTATPRRSVTMFPIQSSRARPTSLFQ